MKIHFVRFRFGVSVSSPGEAAALASRRSRLVAASVAMAVVGLLLVAPVHAFDPANGDFAKADPTHIRVLSYNVENKFIVNPDSDEVFERLITLINPDVIAFQEIARWVGSTDAQRAANIKQRLEEYFPGETWHAHVGVNDGFNLNAIASRYPLSMQITDTVPATDVRGVTSALVDLPDAVYGDTDLYVMGVHFKSFGEQEDHRRRQLYADGIVNWMRDARTPDCDVCPEGDQIDLPLGTPMLVVGDMNFGYLGRGSYAPYHPYETLMSGTIYDEAVYGPSAPPDWNGTGNADAVPYDHNTGNPNTHSSVADWPRSRLDRFLYTDSVMRVENHFLLNTLTMTTAALAAAGLQPGDTVPASDGAPDHLPVVVDFALGPDTRAPGHLVVNEYNFDNPGADTVTFVELKNTGERDVNLMDPVPYRLVTSRNNLPTEPPDTAALQNLDFELRGVVPPGGVYVVYHSTVESVDLATSITEALPPIQRLDRAETGGGFILQNGPDCAFALVTAAPWTTEDGDHISTYTLVEAYLYYDSSPESDKYLLTNSPNNLLIRFGPEQRTAERIVSYTQSYSRNVGDSTLNNYANWTIPDTMTPGWINASPLNTQPVLVAATGITVVRGDTATIHDVHLRVEDAEQPPEELVYTVVEFPTHGALALDAAPFAPGGTETFTQADIDAERLAYAHGGGASETDSFAFTVSDGKGGLIETTPFPIEIAPASGVGNWLLIR